MPLTPFHYPAGYILSKTSRRLSLPGLLVGSVIPDIEVPLMWIFFPGVYDHLVLHSLIGVLTVGTLLAVLVTRIFYPPIISFFFRLNYQEVKQACRITPMLVLSCMLGALFHVIVDIPMHPYNPVLWPWVNPGDIVGTVVLFFAEEGNIALGFIRANTLFTAIMTVLGSIILAVNLGKGMWKRLWIGDIDNSYSQ